MRKLLFPLAACLFVCLSAATASGAANYVKHEQTNNFVATPTCPSSGTNESCGRYVENTDRSGSAGFQVYAPETYTLRFKIEFQGDTDRARVYYTTDGSNPSGSFGTGSGTTQVAVGAYTCDYPDSLSGCQVVDVVTAAIPPQPAGTTVRYVIGAWNSLGGPEVFANSGTCCTACTTASCADVFSYDVLAEPATPLIISEFRLRGPGGAGDEFVEIYNNSDSEVVVEAFDGSGGFALAASDGIARFVIPNRTRIPARGHYLGVNSTGYSLATHPAGDGTTAQGDRTYTEDIADNAGIALFKTADQTKFTTDYRLDAVGSTAELNTTYKEGDGYPAIVPSAADYSFYRDECGKGGSVTLFGPCPRTTPQDTNNNAADFLYVDTSTAGPRLGAPRPENSTSPIVRNDKVSFNLVFPCVSSSARPNRDGTATTLSIRRKITNNSGAPVTRLRFHIVDITTHPVPTGIADLRARSSALPVMSVDNPCTGLPTLIFGTTLETPPAQPNGGGFNSTLSLNSVTGIAPLNNGESRDYELLFNIVQGGKYKIYINVELLP